MKTERKEKFAKVTSLKVKRTLAKAGLAPEMQTEIFNRMFPLNKVKSSIKLRRKVINKILKALEQDGKCGLTLTDSNRIFVISAEHIKFSNFNFQRPEILAKAMKKNRNYQKSITKKSAETAEGANQITPGV